MFDSIIYELYDKNIVRDIIINLKVKYNDIDDLEQEIYMILLTYDKDKIIDMYNKKQLNYFIVGIVKRQYNSRTSPYYKKYKKYYSIVDENTVNAVEITDEEFDIDD